MTSSLLLLFKGPMQSWGDSSRYSQRTTRPMPTKSGVLGLLAAAEGRRRSDPVEDLAQLMFAVRVDQPGTLLRDYQTAEKWQTTGGTKLVERYYLADAVFVAAVESSDDEMIDRLATALQAPRFPLFMGRRSCPVPAKLVLGVKRADATTALREVPWQASIAHQKGRSSTAALPIFRDAMPDERGIAQQDVPVSFAQENRQYSWREVVQDPYDVKVKNENSSYNDPFFEAVISS